MDISDLELSIRAENVLREMKVTTMKQLLQISFEDLSAMKRCGSKTIQEIREKLAKYRLSLKNDYVIMDSESIGMLVKLKDDIEKFLKMQIIYKSRRDT